MIQSIKGYLKSNPSMFYLFLLAVITIILGMMGGMPLNMQDTILAPALNAAKRLGNPHYFASPSFVIYVYTAVYIVLFAFLYITGRVHSAADYRMLFETNTLIENPIHISFQFPGHIITILFSLMGVICTYLIVYKLIKKPLIAFISALFVATSPLWVTNSHLLTVNIPFAALIALTVLLVLRFIREKEPMSLKHVIILGIALGITCSAKYNGALVFVAILVPMLFSYRSNYRQMLKHLMIIGAIAMIIFLILNPYIFLDFKTFNMYYSLQKNQNLYGGGWYGMESVTDHSWAPNLRESLNYGYGILPLILSALGSIFLVVNKKINFPAKLTLIIFPLFFYFIMGMEKPLLYRHMLPLITFLGLYSALGIYSIYNTGMNILKKKATVKNSKLKMVLILCLILISSIALYPNVRDSIKHDALLHKVDTRTDLLNVFNEAGLNGIPLKVYYGRYVSDAIYNNSNITMNKNLFAQSINTNVLEDEADMIVFDSFSHDRVINNNRQSNKDGIYGDYVGLYGLPNDIQKQYNNFEKMYAIQITPFIIPKEQVPFSPQSGTTPFRPDLEFRKQPGPFIEIYFKNQVLAKKVEDSCKKQNIDCMSLSGKDGYYFNNIKG